MSSKRLSGYKLELLASLAGTGWSAVMQLACIPLYIKFIGIEGYGLIGFYLILQTTLQVLDLGLSPTLNREMARYSVQPEKAAEARDLVRTLEAGYWTIGVAIVLSILVAASFISTHWIKSGTIPVQSVRQVVRIMGILAFFQWPLSFYQGGLMGLGRQVLLNILKISQATIANGGAVLILWLVSPTVRAFFLWQVAASIVQVVLLAICFWISLPPADRVSRIDFKLLRNIRQFATGMVGITIFSLILTQTDKVILSRLLDLRVFGYYVLAGMFGTGLSMMVVCVFNTTFPRFSALAAMGNEEALKRLYHRSTQLMAVLIFPVAGVLALFSTDILNLWTRNAEIAHNAGPIAALLVIGTALNGIMNLPFALQLAYGWTSIGLRITIFLTIVIVPAIWFMATRYGAVGAASVWVALNCIYVAIGVPLTHRRLLKGEAWRWFGDIALPLAMVLLIVLIGRAVVSASASAAVMIRALLFLVICATAAAGLAAPSIRSWLIDRAVAVRSS